MKAVGIRELKDRLSRYLDEVRHGEVILVTDRGQVIAQIERPRTPPARTPSEEFLAREVERGNISVPAPRDPSVYVRSEIAMSADEIAAALDETRGES